jgi:hypothetical protein
MAKTLTVQYCTLMNHDDRGEKRAIFYAKIKCHPDGSNKTVPPVKMHVGTNQYKLQVRRISTDAPYIYLQRFSFLKPIFKDIHSQTNSKRKKTKEKTYLNKSYKKILWIQECILIEKETFDQLSLSLRIFSIFFFFFLS